MPLDVDRVRRRLHQCDLAGLFTQELGWDHHSGDLLVTVAGCDYALAALAEKRGMVAFHCAAADGQALPDYAARRKIERQVARSVHEHLIVFTDGEQSTQIWQWVKREAGRPAVSREHPFHNSQPGDSLIQKLQALEVTLAEEASLTILDAAGKAKAAFDVDKVTKRFYDRFQKEHAAFLKFIKGIPADDDRAWYASLMLNRLMFVYFIQEKGFLDSDLDYLRNRLAAMQARKGKDKFLSFYRHFLLRLFHDGLNAPKSSRAAELDRLLGAVPYLNGGLFDVHQLEEHNPQIAIADQAFEKLFDFFDTYQWHLDERPLRADNEINPDVLGYIFEKYVNQKQMGAYYTKEDITEYIGKNTIIPFLFDAAEKKCAIAFRPDSALWRLLQEDPDRYIYEAVRRGVIDAEGSVIPLPEEIAAGVGDVSQRGGWNRPADPDFALPTETWREHVARRTRCLELRAKLAAGEVHQVNDLVTFNLDIRRFAQDAVEACEGPDLLRAFYQAITSVSVLDPTCGSGAFLFAALNILEPLYEACLKRMRAFVDELKRSGKKASPKKFDDFRKTLAQVRRHPNEKYFVFKSIIIHNLYGVDIMEEAVEICKLRLFLKLVAQVECDDQLEPLPDIDFNIRAGNTLVGYVSLDEIRKAVEREQSGQGKLQFTESLEELEDIEEAARLADSAYQRFREMQTDHGMDAEQFADAKVEVRKRLQALGGKLDRYLAGEYGVDPRNQAKYGKWRFTHQPFHWLVEFFGIMSHGGFDTIIGNPPYLDITGFTAYQLKDYTTLSTRNLYPLVLERCRRLVNSSGQLGFIVPVSSIATEGYLPLQRILAIDHLVVSSYDDRPSHLFDGLDKNTLSILLSHSPSTRGGLPACFSTRLCRWNAQERGHLFASLQFYSTPPGKLPGCVPKIGKAIEASIWNRIFLTSQPLETWYATTEKHVTYYSRKVNAFLQILDFVPEVRDGKGKLRPPSEFKTLSFGTSAEAKVVFCLFNSTLFRWFMDTVSDGSHLNRREVDNFPFNPCKAAAEYPYLLDVACRLSQNLRRTSETRVMRYKHDTLTVQCIIAKTSKAIIDEIDQALGAYYGFGQEEIDFLVNYDIKYRMGQVEENRDEK